MTQRRSNVEIVAEILRITRRGARKTRIVYGANLNFKMLREYLDKLERAGLIVKQPSEGLIKITERGRKYLQYYEELKNFGTL